jgi:hypothetical protein
MSHLFVPKAPFQDWGEFPFDGSNLSQLLAALIMVASIASLVAVVSVSLISILVGEPLSYPYGAGTVFPLTPLASVRELGWIV